MKYDVGKLKELILKAQGERSLNQFAQHCGLDAGNLSRIINGKNERPPKPDTLSKIANHAYNGVTYEALMNAAGYLTVNKSNIKAETAPEELNLPPGYLRVAKEAHKKGLTPEDINMAIDFLMRARIRDEEAKKEKENK